MFNYAPLDSVRIYIVVLLLNDIDIVVKLILSTKTLND